MTILKDTGWVTQSRRCHYSGEREVVFDPSTPIEVMQAMVDEHNAKPPRGQYDQMWIVEGTNIVRGRFECDSSG